MGYFTLYKREEIERKRDRKNREITDTRKQSIEWEKSVQYLRGKKVGASIVLILGSCDAIAVGNHRVHEKEGGAGGTKGRANINQ